MVSERWERIQSLFLEAIDRPSHDRSRFLENACGEDPKLLEELRAMLAAHSEEAAIGMEGWFSAAAHPSLSSALVGTRIGPYRVDKLIGQGGMGDVYLAERDDDQFQQQVALKLLGTDLLTSETASRFRAERQILARLAHANIARLLDGGVTDQGRPYIVMEYVAGVPITEYCDERHLSVQERIHLFRSVCGAVEFAHQHLIVHRDIKPSNVLVSRVGEVKLLDFGIAKLLEPEIAGVTAPLTRSELRIMTAECAAPEQVMGEPITTATDVYALGVLLYELLSGHPPYQLSRREPGELERLICVESPARPSTKVTTESEARGRDGRVRPLTPARVSADRSTQPARLRRALHGDLDNIVMMALRKEPSRRYASATQLSEDLLRYLERRPVIARRDTFGYRFQRFVRRNRWGVTAATAFALLLIASAIVTIWQARQVTSQRDVARLEAAKSEQVTSLLLDLFEAGAPTSAARDTLRVRDMLDTGRRRVEELSDQPEVQADMFTVLSQAYWRLGRTDLAADLAERAVDLRRAQHGSTSEATAEAAYWLGTLRQSQQRLEEAEQLYREALKIYRAQRGEADPTTLKTQYRVGLVLHMMQRSAEADELLQNWNETLLERPAGNDEDLAITLSALAPYFQYAGRLEVAESAARRAIEIRTNIYGAGDYRIGDDMNVLSGILIARNRPEEAETVARDALAVHRKLFPEGHFALARSLDAVGEALILQERYAEAEPFLQEALTVYQKLHGEEHPFVARGNMMLGQLYHKWKRFDLAESHYRTTIEIYERNFGSAFPTTIQSRRLLAVLLQNQGRFDAAAQILQQDYETLLKERGADDRHTLEAKERLAAFHEARHGAATESPRD